MHLAASPTPFVGVGANSGHEVHKEEHKGHKELEPGPLAAGNYSDRTGACYSFLPLFVLIYFVNCSRDKMPFKVSLRYNRENFSESKVMASPLRSKCPPYTF